MNFRELPDEALLRASEFLRPIGPVPHRKSTWWARVKTGDAPKPDVRTAAGTWWTWGTIRGYLIDVAAGRAR